MALFGYFIVARSGRPLSELACVQRLCAEGIDGIGPGTPCEPRADGDWQFLQVLGGWGLDVDDVARETGGPALVVYVIESAVGVVETATPDGDYWRGCLNPDDAVRAFDFPPDDAGTPQETAHHASRWAEAAGRVPDPAAVEAAASRYVGPFGDAVDDFVAALGFRFTEFTETVSR